MHYTLGQWSVFPAENNLINQQSQEVIHLEPKSMAALKLFMENPGEVIGIEKFMEVIWQNRIVGDHAVYRAINQLRKSLNPDDKNAFIINIPKQGYKLILPVQLEKSELQHAKIRSDKSKFKFMGYGLLLTFVGMLLWLQLNQSDSEVSAVYQHTKPLTTDIGNKKDPHFSPDGVYMAYSQQVENNNPYRAFILNLSTNQEHQITEIPGSESNPVLSKDAKRLVLIRRSSNDCRVILIENPLATSSSESELFKCDWQNMDLEISHNGETLYYTQATEPNNQHKIYALSIDTKKAIQLTTIHQVNSQGDRIISLSPDNKKLAFLRDNDWKWSEIGILDLDTFEETFYLKTSGWFNSLGWTHNSDQIIYQDSNRSLSLFSPRKGSSKKITSGFTQDILAISHNTVNSDLAIAFGQKKGGITIKLNPLFQSSDELEMNPMMVQSTEVDTFPSFANHSKRLAFMSKRSGSAQIWLKAESGEEIQITRYTDQRSVRTIRWSPGDEYLLTETADSISRINVNDKTQTMLVAEGEYGSVGGSTWSHDGSGIYFSSGITGDSQLYHLDIESGETMQITSKGGIMAFPSPNEDELFLLKPHQPGLWIHDMVTGSEEVVVDEIDSSLHRSIQVKQSGLYYASRQGDIKKYAFHNDQITKIDVGISLLVPILSVSDDERLLAFPYYNKTDTSIFLLSH